MNKLERALDQAQQGASLDRILLSLVGEDEQSLLRLCALPRSFDRGLFDVTLRPEVAGDSDFARLITHPLIEAAEEDGQYRLLPGPRREYLRDWLDPESQQPSDAMRRLSDAIERHYTAHSEPLEALYHQLAASPDSALQTFKDLFDDADRRFDLATCHDLLDVLDERLGELNLPPSFREFKEDQRLYAGARGLWTEAHGQTRSFLAPAGMMERFNALLSGEPSRVLQLHAPGGTGKTMQLRWLVARHLAPEPRRVPCARIDFDRENPRLGTQYPWLLLLAIADQLRPQIRGQPFGELVAEHGDLMSLLYPRHDSGVDLSVAHLRRLADEVEHRFVSEMLEADIGDAVVIVLDTLEEILLRRSTEPQELIELFARIHQKCPQLRLIFSGRYPLDAERLPSFEQRFGTIPTFLLRPFTEDEARRYLTQMRGLNRSDVVEAVVRKARLPLDPDQLEQSPGCLPFKVSLLADIVRETPGLTAAEIDADEDADLTYLIRRVVQRIEDLGVRWLLRYGVVPRRLDFDFVDRVMRPYLLAAMRGEVDFDRLDRESTPEAFPRPDRETDLKPLWRQLKRYASASSWISIGDSSGKTLIFHGDVRAPMRRILRSYPVYRRLHEDAIDHFEQRFESSSERPLDDLAEVAYHRFQRQGPQAGEWWWQQVRDAERRDDLEACRRLAEEILGPEYLNDDGEPRAWDSRRAILGARTLVQAHFTLARACALLARRLETEGDPTLWSVAARSLAEADRLEEDRQRPVISAGRRALVAGLVEAYAGHRAEASQSQRRAVEIFRRHLRAVRGPDRVALHTAYADLLAELGESESSDAHYSVALGASLGIEVDDGATNFRVVRKQALAKADRDCIDQALAICETALPSQPPDSSRRSDLLLLRAELTLRLGSPERALRRAEGVEAQTLPPARQRDLEALKIRARLANLEPLRARRLAEDAWDDLDERPDEIREQAAASFRLGLAHEALLEYEEASDAFDQANGLYTQLSHRQGRCRCFNASARLALRVEGHLGRAENWLNNAEDSDSEPGLEEDLTCRMLRAEWHDYRGDGEAARQRIDQAIIDASLSAPRIRVQLALAGLARVHQPTPEPYLELLASALEQVRPASGRLVLLDDLARCPSLDPPSSGRRETWMQLLEDAEIGTEGRDRALQELRRVEVEGVLLGRPKRAAELLEGVRRRLASSSDGIFAYRAWARSAGRLNLPTRFEEFHTDFRRVFQEQPLLCGAVELEEVERQLAVGDRSAVLLGLARARRELDQLPKRLTRWHARQVALQCHPEVIGSELPEAVDRLRQKAAGLYSELDDARAQREIEKWQAAERAAADVPADIDDLKPIRLILERRTAPKPEIVVRTEDVHISLKSVAPLLHDLLASGDQKSLVSRRLIEELLRETRDISREMSLMVNHHSPSESNPELALELRDRRLQAVPWELHSLAGPAVPQEELHPPTGSTWARFYRTLSTDRAARARTRQLQLVLSRLVEPLAVDGIKGPATRRALQAFQERAGLPTDGRFGVETADALEEGWTAHLAETELLQIFLAQASRESEKGSFRGSQRLGIEIVDDYAQAGFQVRVEVDPPRDRIFKNWLETAAKQPVPRAIHFCGGLREDSGQVTLHFGLSSRFEDGLTTTDLDTLWRGFPEDRPKPLLILDIDRPSGESEALRQMMLRNVFAGEVFALGAIPAIFATGLTNAHSQMLFYKRLITGLRRGRSIFEICRDLQIKGLEDGLLDLDFALPFHGSALFAPGRLVVLPD